jgi:hypothetical protein
VADFFHAPEKIMYGCETDVALAEDAAGDHLGLEFIVLSEEEMFGDANLSSGTHQAFPFVGIALDLPCEQNLDASVKEIAGCGIAMAHWLRSQSAAASVEARGEYAGVVEDDQVGWA